MSLGWPGAPEPEAHVGCEREGGQACVWNTLLSAACVSRVLQGPSALWPLVPPPIPLALDPEGMGSRISVLGSVLVYLSDHLSEAFVPGQNAA